MNVYIASLFSDKDRIKTLGDEITSLGIGCTSRWIFEAAPHTATIKDFPDEYFRETAVFDIEDIVRADKLILMVPSDRMMTDVPIRSLARGGRTFESGLFYGLILAQFFATAKSDRELIVCGPRENVFHFLDGMGAAAKYPAIRQFDGWDEVKKYLVEEQYGSTLAAC